MDVLQIQINIDCHDLGRMVDFYTAALGYVAHGAVGDRYRSIVPADGDGPKLVFQRVPEDKVVKNRVHLGCHAGTLDDLDAETARLLALGATVAWEEDFPPEVAARYRNVVLRDPEGNEFCLSAGSWRT